MVKHPFLSIPCGMVWMNQNQLTELFATSVPNISTHISNILKEGELNVDSVIKGYLTTASDGKEYKVVFFSLDMILAIGVSEYGVNGTLNFGFGPTKTEIKKWG